MGMKVNVDLMEMAVMKMRCRLGGKEFVGGGARLSKVEGIECGCGCAGFGS